MCLFFFFFFQAEDGIRDYKVTGVQTCALPISRAPPGAPPSAARAAAEGEVGLGVQVEPVGRAGREPRRASERDHGGIVGRSEEHTSELQSPCNLVCRLLLEKKKNILVA